MEADQLLAFRVVRAGLGGPRAPSLAEAATCPASDFAHDAALLALAARASGVTREAYDAAVEAGDVVLAHVIRGAIHALRPQDHPLLGRALVAHDDEALAVQLGQQVRRLAEEHGLAPTAVLDEVVAATRAALAGGRRVTKDELHEELRARTREELQPWCRGCGSHHVAPMLWRWALVAAGGRLDAQRRHLLDDAAPGPPPHPTEAVRRFLEHYGPATPGEFALWAGLPGATAKRLWAEVAPELEETRYPEGRRVWLRAQDADELADPPATTGVRLLPPGDPLLQGSNRPLVAPDPALRKQLFRPVASPGVVLRDGRLAGTWRLRRKGRKAVLEVERAGPARLPAKRALTDEAQHVAAAKGLDDVAVQPV